MTILQSQVVEILGPRQIHIRPDVLDLDDLKPTEIAARTICSVVSPGTEGAAYRGDPPLRSVKPYPRVVGYCNVGKIVACGEKVTTVRPGDLVLTNQPHRSAFICHEQKILAHVPSAIEPPAAATTYLFQLGYNAVIRGNLERGQTLAIVGLGTLGLATAAVASTLGAQVYAFSDQKFDPAFLKQFGIKHLFKKSQNSLVKAAADQVGVEGIDIVVSTSNIWADWQLALSLPRKYGTICVLGFPGRGMLPPAFNPLSSEFFYDRQLKIIACGMTPDATAVPAGVTFNLQENCRLLLNWIERRLLPAAALVSTTVRWQELAEVYERITLPEPGFLTAALTWD